MNRYSMEDLWGPSRKKPSVIKKAKIERAKFKVKLVNGGYVSECNEGIMVVSKEHADVFTEEEAHRFIYQNWLEATMIPIGRSS